ncbi:MAG: aspartate aminotransferase family protein [Sulfitobacter sp.]|nr:MAG: aspartate aminotransferase family protein [Sulfitobacter sp.]
MTSFEILSHAAKYGIEYRNKVKTKSPYPVSDANGLRRLFDIALPDKGRPAVDVINQLVHSSEQGLVGSTGDAFFGWVMGASNTVGIAADWLTSAWGQNSAIYQTAPSAAIAEEVAGKWLIDLLKLPAESSVAFTTGATMASFISLAAARGEVLRRHCWDLEAQGMFSAPEVKVYVSEEAHSSIFAVLRYLGFGHERLIRVAAIEDGAMSVADLEARLQDGGGPSIIIAQAGHINTGACDDFKAISSLAKKANAWLHIDGAFGLWAQSSAKLSYLCDGVDKADSWAVDGHKWIQVPYDSGYAIIKDKTAHCRAMATTAGYLNETVEDGRNPTHFAPELSRRARGFTVWAVLQHLGRQGISKIVEGNVYNARQLATHLKRAKGIRVLHKVYLNQLAVMFEDDFGPSSDLTLKVVTTLQEENRWFVKEAEWRGKTILRISFSSATKTEAQIQDIAGDIVRIWQDIRATKTALKIVPMEALDISPL